MHKSFPFFCHFQQRKISFFCIKTSIFEHYFFIFSQYNQLSSRGFRPHDCSISYNDKRREKSRVRSVSGKLWKFACLLIVTAQIVEVRVAHVGVTIMRRRRMWVRWHWRIFLKLHCGRDRVVPVETLRNAFGKILEMRWRPNVWSRAVHWRRRDVVLRKKAYVRLIRKLVEGFSC